MQIQRFPCADTGIQHQNDDCIVAHSQHMYSSSCPEPSRKSARQFRSSRIANSPVCCDCFTSKIFPSIPPNLQTFVPERSNSEKPEIQNLIFRTFREIKKINPSKTLEFLNSVSCKRYESTVKSEKQNRNLTPAIAILRGGATERVRDDFLMQRIKKSSQTSAVRDDDGGAAQI